MLVYERYDRLATESNPNREIVGSKEGLWEVKGECSGRVEN